MLNYSRFHAIVSAKPLHGHGPPVIPEGIYRLPYEPWAPHLQDGEQNMNGGDAGPSARRKIARRSSEDEGHTGREVRMTFSSTPKHRF